MNTFTLTPLETGLRLLLAALLGSVVGYERQRKEGSAGLRTHMLVCLGSSLIMIVSAFGFGDILGRPAVVLDPSRVAAQVVSGIGFLGAGTILFLGQRVVRGLTTAAGLWSVAAVGLAVGGGLYTAAVMTTVIVIVILWLIKPLEDRFFHRGKARSDEALDESAPAPIGSAPAPMASCLTLTMQKGRGRWQDIEPPISASHLQLSQIVIKPCPEADEEEVVLTFAGGADQKQLFNLLEELRGIPGVKEIKTG